MRLRLPELLEERGMTAYQLASESGGRISLSTIYRLTRQQGRVRYFDAEVLEAICDTLGIEPGELFARDAARTKRTAKRSKAR